VKTSVTCFLAGIIFALGLGISGMTRPIKVIDFLDFFENWDPSLAFVMIGAIAVYFLANRRRLTMLSPLLAAKFAIPTRSDLDASLIIGAAIFGVGWGLGGFCPGPALTSLASGSFPVIIFVAAMAAGIYLYTFAADHLAAPPARPATHPMIISQPSADS
jgi:uncharacterized membrane protein YedE/YeeE